MQITTHQTLKMAQPRPYSTFRHVQPVRRVSTPVQKPDHGGLSQAELRRIVIDMIG
jgi:hypothetical protein